MNPNPLGGPLLEARGISYAVPDPADVRRAKLLVEAASLELRAGELVGIIGPNGAGKSTLLRLLSGYLRPVSGYVAAAGRSLAGMKSRERARLIAALGPHDPAGFGYTCAEIAEMGSFAALGLGRPPGPAERSAALEALAYVGLRSFAGREFASLSAGERQLALFARLLVQNTPIILLDEPTANLDLGHEQELFGMLRELCAEGRAAVTAVHNLDLAARYCTRLVLVRRGRIEAEGTPEAVLDERVLEACYGTQVKIAVNEITGSPTVTAYRRAAGPGPRIHLIGGAGSAVTLTRRLYLLGCRLSGGIAHDGDSDLRLWESLGIPSVAVPAFASIGDTEFSEAAALVGEADAAVLCCFPVGTGNARNLELARHARRLIILESEPGERRRDFFDPQARALFAKLAADTEAVSFEDAVVAIGSLAPGIAPSGNA